MLVVVNGHILRLFSLENLDGHLRCRFSHTVLVETNRSDPAVFYHRVSTGEDRLVGCVSIFDQVLHCARDEVVTRDHHPVNLGEHLLRNLVKVIGAGDCVDFQIDVHFLGVRNHHFGLVFRGRVARRVDQAQGLGVGEKMLGQF